MKTKIVLDADVIIHFSKGNMLSILPKIFKNYDFIVLDIVYNEIRGALKSQLDNQIQLLKNITLVKFDPSGEELREYAYLITTKGKGESACLAYCRFRQNIIGSSNLKDIILYCQQHSITHLTTLDFLYHAIEKRIITIKEADDFIIEVKQKGSKLPDIDMAYFTSSVIL